MKKIRCSLLMTQICTVMHQEKKFKNTLYFLYRRIAEAMGSHEQKVSCELGTEVSSTASKFCTCPFVLTVLSLYLVP